MIKRRTNKCVTTKNIRKDLFFFSRRRNELLIFFTTKTKMYVKLTKRKRRKSLSTHSHVVDILQSLFTNTSLSLVYMIGCHKPLIDSHKNSLILAIEFYLHANVIYPFLVRVYRQTRGRRKCAVL
jgi:hypothetical protein